MEMVVRVFLSTVTISPLYCTSVPGRGDGDGGESVSVNCHHLTLGDTQRADIGINHPHPQTLYTDDIKMLHVLNWNLTWLDNK